jgi:GNAT superfamily N-acetyltransferase
LRIGGGWPAQAYCTVFFLHRARRRTALQTSPGEAFEEFRERYTPEGFLDTLLTSKTLEKRRLETMSVFMAVHSREQVAGTIAWNVVGLEEGHLRGMAVLPLMRGSGIASQLLSRAESELQQRKCTRVTLDTTEPLLRAMRFCEKHGYRRSGKTKDFFGMPLIEYQKTLLQGVSTPAGAEDKSSYCLAVCST